MRSRITRALEGRIVSLWWMFFIDILVIYSVFAFAYVLRLNFNCVSLNR